MEQIPCLIRPAPLASYLKTLEKLWSVPFHPFPMKMPTPLSQILTGAQIPLSQLRNDAVDNLLGALTIAGHYIIPGTLVLFRSWMYIHRF